MYRTTLPPGTNASELPFNPDWEDGAGTYGLNELDEDESRLSPGGGGLSCSEVLGDEKNGIYSPPPNSFTSSAGTNSISSVSNVTDDEDEFTVCALGEFEELPDDGKEFTLIALGDFEEPNDEKEFTSIALGDFEELLNDGKYSSYPSVPGFGSNGFPSPIYIKLEELLDDEDELSEDELGKLEELLDDEVKFGSSLSLLLSLNLANSFCKSASVPTLACTFTPFPIPFAPRSTRPSLGEQREVNISFSVMPMSILNPVSPHAPTRHCMPPLTTLFFSSTFTVHLAPHDDSSYLLSTKQLFPDLPNKASI
jgi:hypothetical protein